MWRPRKGEGGKQVVSEGSGLDEARQARRAAEYSFAVTQSEVTIPLRDLHRENHIQPLINNLIRKRAERGAET
jgi:hypothetical protein